MPGPTRVVRPRLAAFLTAAGVAAALSATTGATPPSGVERASASKTLPSSRALLGLYALESRLALARKRLEDANARVDALAARQRSAEAQLRLAEETFVRAQGLLAERVRDLYVAGEPDPLAIVLGAGSLDDAMAGIEDLRRVASQNETTVVVTRRARTSLRRLTAQLEVRQARLEAVRDEAAASAASLESALAARRAYIARLRTQERMKAAQVASLAQQARDVQAQAEHVTASSSTALSPAEAAAVVSTSATGWAARTMTVSATGYAIHGRTATGAPTGTGVVAVDPAVIPLGTRMTIPGYGEGVAADTGGAVRGATIDLWFPTIAQARAWGRRTVTITLH